MKSVMLSRVSILATCTAMSLGTAHAQEMASASTQPSQPSVAAQQDGSEPAAGLQDIIVTAQRRTESVQKSSLAISVLSGEQLARQGVLNARDIGVVAPSVSIAQNGPNVQTNIRGAGDAASNALAGQAVSYMIDGIIIGQGSQIGGNFYDLARIEVLKGPQGTLYGRNATGGAINLISNRPTHEFAGNLSAEYGNYDAKRLTGAINVPIGDKLAVRAAFNLIDRDGYLSDGTDDDVRQAFRVQALWDISPDVSLRVAGDYAHTGGKGGGAVLWPPQPGTSPWDGYTDPRNVAALMAGTSVTLPGLGTFPLQGPVTQNSFMDNDTWSISAELTARIGDFATLTVLPGYRHQIINSNSYNIGFLTEARDNRDEQKSLEVRLSNTTDKLKWVIGGFLYDDDTRVFLDNHAASATAQLVLQRFSAILDVPSYRKKSSAVFGEATYSLTDRLRVIGGMRYTHDRIQINGKFIDESPPAVALPDLILNAKQNFNSVTWKTGFEYDVSPSSMLFFTASKGNKAGGFFAGSPVDQQYQPEFLTAFSLGSRNRFFDNTLQVNLELFYWRYRDQQLSAIGFTKDANIAYVTRNAGASDPRGVEAEVVWQPTPADTFTANLSYNRAKFKSFIINFPAPLLPALRAGPECRVPTTPTLSSGLPVLALDCSGAPVPRTPEFSGSASYTHRFDLAGGGSISAGGSMTFATSRFLTADLFTPETKDRGYVLLNADLNYTAPDKRYTISAFIRNIANRAVYQGAFTNVTTGFPTLLGGPASAPTFVARNIGAPRTYGVRVGFDF